MDELMRSIEATLFASAEPLSIEEIAEHVGEGQVEIALGQLAASYEGRGIELVERAFRDLDSADGLDLGAADRFVIGDDR